MKQGAFITIILIIAVIVTGNGNADTIRLIGKVRDNWWAPVHDASVTVIYGNGEVQANTDESGQYEIILENIQTSINSLVNNPVNFTLLQNYPNPFNPSTTIHFNLVKQQHVRLIIYSITGQMVRKLVDEKREAGNHFVLWDGTDERSKHVSAGVYFYRLEAGGAAQARKMMLLDGGSGGGSGNVPVSPKRVMTHNVGAAVQLTISIEASGYYSMTEAVTLPVTDDIVSCVSTITRTLPEGIGDNDIRFVLGRAMEMALDPLVIGDSYQFIEKDSIHVSTRNVDVTLVPEIKGKTLVFMSPDEIQKKADTEGDFPYYSFGSYGSVYYIQITSEKIILSMRLGMAVGKNSPHSYLWGGGYTADFIRQEDKSWDIRVYDRWISKI